MWTERVRKRCNKWLANEAAYLLSAHNAVQPQQGWELSPRHEWANSGISYFLEHTTKGTWVRRRTFFPQSSHSKRFHEESILMTTKSPNVEVWDISFSFL